MDFEYDGTDGLRPNYGVRGVSCECKQHTTAVETILSSDKIDFKPQHEKRSW